MLASMRLGQRVLLPQTRWQRGPQHDVLGENGQTYILRNRFRCIDSDVGEWLVEFGHRAENGFDASGDAGAIFHEPYSVDAENHRLLSNERSSEKTGIMPESQRMLLPFSFEVVVL